MHFWTENALPSSTGHSSCNNPHTIAIQRLVYDNNQDVSDALFERLHNLHRRITCLISFLLFLIIASTMYMSSKAHDGTHGYFEMYWPISICMIALILIAPLCVARHVLSHPERLQALSALRSQTPQSRSTQTQCCPHQMAPPDYATVVDETAPIREHNATPPPAYDRVLADGAR